MQGGVDSHHDQRQTGEQRAVNGRFKSRDGDGRVRASGRARAGLGCAVGGGLLHAGRKRAVVFLACSFVTIAHQAIELVCHHAAPPPGKQQ